MKAKKAMAMMAALCILLAALPISALAAQNVGIAVTLSPTGTRVGEEVTVTCALTGDAGAAVPLTGIQVDVTGVTEEVRKVLEVVSCESLIEDPSALSNAASDQPGRDLLRLLYYKSAQNAVMELPAGDVFKVVFRVKPGVTETGSIVLPVVLTAVSADSEYTHQADCVIEYLPAAAVSVDMEWGAMEFTYSQGVWNPQTHSYDGAGWVDNGTGYVTLTNTGEADTSAAFRYETDRTDVAGAFDVTGAELPVGTSQTAYLTLSGVPSEELDKVTLGTAIVTIGGEPDGA